MNDNCKMILDFNICSGKNIFTSIIKKYKKIQKQNSYI